MLDDNSSWNTPSFWWNKHKHGSTHGLGLLGQSSYSYLVFFWFLYQCLHAVAAFFFFPVGGIVERWWKDVCGFKLQFGGGEPIKFVTIDFQKSFMLFFMGFVAEKDFHDVNPNFLIPYHSFLQCRVVQQHFIWSIDSWHMVGVDTKFGFLLDLPCLLTESITVGTWALLMTQTSLLSFHLVT